MQQAVYRAPGARLSAGPDGEVGHLGDRAPGLRASGGAVLARSRDLHHGVRRASRATDRVKLEATGCELARTLP